MNERERAHFRVRSVGQPASWADMPIVATYQIDPKDTVSVQSAIIEAYTTHEVNTGEIAAEVRWNLAGSFQGHYANIAPHTTPARRNTSCQER